MLSPMSDDALAELEQLLETRAVPSGGVTLEWLDGFFSALIVGPATHSPAHHLDRIWGSGLAGDDAAGFDALVAATVAFWNHIAWRVAQPLADEEVEADPEDMLLMPLLQIPAFDGEADEIPDSVRGFPAGALWADGFFHGVAQADDGWERWFGIDDSLLDDFDRLQRLVLLGPGLAAPADADAADADADADISPDFEERWRILVEVPGLLQYCNRMRQEGAFPPAPRRREAVIGRNDPCPCGSGRKFKKCCGGATLH